MTDKQMPLPVRLATQSPAETSPVTRVEQTRMALMSKTVAKQRVQSMIAIDNFNRVTGLVR